MSRLINDNNSLGDVFTCGKGEGTLGHGDTVIRTTPKRLEGLAVSSCYSLSFLYYFFN